MNFVTFLTTYQKSSWTEGVVFERVVTFKNMESEKDLRGLGLSITIPYGTTELPPEDY